MLQYRKGPRFPTFARAVFTAPLITVIMVFCCAGCADVPSAGTPDTDPDVSAVDSLSEVAADAAGDSDDSTNPAPGPVINEVAPAGTPHDWFEMYNPTSRPVDLTGWSFADGKTGTDHRAAFPDLSVIPPMGRLLVSFSDTYPGFGLGPAESLTVFGPDGSVADRTEWRGADAPAGKSWGRFPDGSGEFKTLACQTPNAENSELKCDVLTPSDFLFDPFAVSGIEITLPQTSIDSLNAESHVYVGGKVRIKAGDRFDSGALDVGVKLKGRYGSFVTLDGKSAFKIKFDFTDASADLLGLDVINVNNMVQDCSMIHEQLAYRIFRAFDVPALRAGWAKVSVNGQDYGFYLLLERYDKAFFKRHYATTAHVYEGAYGIDLTIGNEPNFEVNEGDPANRSDLSGLIDAVSEQDSAVWMQKMAAHADMAEMMRMWAVEQYVGHWDGYAPTINNYFMHADDNGVFTMHPWGLDQTFGDFRDYHSGSAILFGRCMDVPECRDMYDRTLNDLLPVVDSLNLEQYAKDLAAFIAPWAESDPRKPCGDLITTQQWTYDFINARRWHAGMVFPCFLNPGLDADADGTVCTQDCNDLDNTVYPGARDICDDGIDQDCNGLADDGQECPDCREIKRGPHRYLFCTNVRTWNDARAACIDNGSDLAVMNTPSEQSWLLSQIPGIGIDSFWIGLSDAESEGIFAWVDGSVVDFASWADNEPNNSGGDEDCVQLYSGGAWNDMWCGGELAALCEDLCPAGRDWDNDGYSPCVDDCDDGNGSVNPGAEDVCGDWIDQDCDGMIDGRPECYGPYEVPVDIAVANNTKFIIQVVPADWQTARKLCMKYGPGADLAWFDDILQQQVVNDILWAAAGPLEYWIGLNDIAEEGIYIWHGDAEPSYTDWAENQPNNGGDTGQDCTRINSDKLWNDTACESAYVFLCRVP